MSSDNACALRFLWLENVNSNEKSDTFQTLVHIFGGKIHLLVQIMQIAGFNFTKFQSNKKEVINCFPPLNLVSQQ